MFGAPAQLLSVLLPSISAKARSTVASEYDDAPHSGRCGCVCHSSSRRTLDRASGCWGVGAGSAARREEKGHEACELRTYFEALVYERHVHFHAPELLTESSDDRSRSHASPHAFALKLPRNLPTLSQPLEQQCGRLRVYLTCERKGLGCALALQYCRACRGGGDTNRTWSAYWRRMFSVISCCVMKEMLAVGSKMSMYEVARTFQTNWTQYFPFPSPYHPF